MINISIDEAGLVVVKNDAKIPVSVKHNGGLVMTIDAGQGGQFMMGSQKFRDTKEIKVELGF